jgi:hypothetical protein
LGCFSGKHTKVRFWRVAGQQQQQQQQQQQRACIMLSLHWYQGVERTVKGVQCMRGIQLTVMLFDAANVKIQSHGNIAGEWAGGGHCGSGAAAAASTRIAQSGAWGVHQDIL